MGGENMTFLINILKAIVSFIVAIFSKKPAQPPSSPGDPPANPDPEDPTTPIDPNDTADPTEPKPMKPLIIQDFIPVGRGNRPRYAMSPRFITIHDTGNPRIGANAKAHASYLKGDTAANLPVSWHFTVDDTEVYQHLPLNENGWHAGDGNGLGNRSSIGIEICENADGNREKAEENAALLVAWLHHEVSSVQPFPSGMKQHFNWSGKNCPHIIRGRPEGWQGFLNSVPLKQTAGELE